MKTTLILPNLFHLMLNLPTALFISVAAIKQLTSLKHQLQPLLLPVFAKNSTLTLFLTIIILIHLMTKTFPKLLLLLKLLLKNLTKLLNLFHPLQLATSPILDNLKPMTAKNANNQFNANFHLKKTDTIFMKMLSITKTISIIKHASLTKALFNLLHHSSILLQLLPNSSNPNSNNTPHFLQLKPPLYPKLLQHLLDNLYYQLFLASFQHHHLFSLHNPLTPQLHNKLLQLLLFNIPLQLLIPSLHILTPSSLRQTPNQA